MADACCKPGPPFVSAQPSGQEEKWGNVDVYVTGSRSAETAVILIPDIFGYHIPLTRTIADKVSAAGHLAVLPDLLNGDPFYPEKCTIQDWFKIHPFGPASVEAEALVQKILDLGIKRIGVVGFCWGAKVGVKLAASDAVGAAVFHHPSLVTVEDIKAVKAATAILSAEEDVITPKELAEEYRQAFAADSNLANKTLVEIVKDVQHGWTIRYNVNNPTEVAQAEEAHKIMLDWFAKYL